MVNIPERILSPTSINTYLNCPRKFYLRYIQRVKSRPNIHLIRGQVVHRTLNTFNKNHPQILPGTPIGSIRSELMTTFNQRWDRARDQLSRLNVSPEEQEQFRQESEKMLLNYSHWLWKQDFKGPDASELRLFSDKLRLMGMIDALYQKPGQATIIDYKTSQKTVVTDDMTRQAALYALLYQERYGAAPEAAGIHFLIEPGDPVLIHIDEHLLDYGQLLLDNIRKQTQSRQASDYPCTCGGWCEQDLIKC